MRKFTTALLVLGWLLSVAGCVSTGETAQDIHYTLQRDLSYGSHKRNVVDISIPDGAAPGGVILFIHGGIWMYGRKENYPAFLDAFRNRFVVASMNHRYIDDTVHIKDLEDDVAAAVVYIREFCLQNRAEPGKLIIMGHSSGAHLAMLYAYKRHGTSPIPVAFCVDMAGPADLGDLAFLYVFKNLGKLRVFYQLAEKMSGYHIAEGDVSGEGYSESGREMLAAISPIRFVTPGSPPTIMIHAVGDGLVPYSNSAALNSVFNVYGIDHEFIALYSGIGHFFGVKRNRGGGRRYDKALEARIAGAMNEYIDRYCK
jgi:acetyl esterase/lipase